MQAAAGPSSAADHAGSVDQSNAAGPSSAANGSADRIDADGYLQHEPDDGDCFEWKWVGHSSLTKEGDLCFPAVTREEETISVGDYVLLMPDAKGKLHIAPGKQHGHPELKLPHGHRCDLGLDVQVTLSHRRAMRCPRTTRSCTEHCASLTCPICVA